jgi:hypothetical protein
VSNNCIPKFLLLMVTITASLAPLLRLSTMQSSSLDSFPHKRVESSRCTCLRGFSEEIGMEPHDSSNGVKFHGALGGGIRGSRRRPITDRPCLAKATYVAAFIRSYGWLTLVSTSSSDRKPAVSMVCISAECHHIGDIPRKCIPFVFPCAAYSNSEAFRDAP